jgi:F-type H+-transporting ATPase subunit delta
MTEQKVSARYARALFDLALENKLQEVIFTDLKYVSSTILSSSDLASVLRSPVITSHKKIKILEEIFASNVDKLTMNFITLLANKTRENLITSIYYQFEIIYNEFKNNIPVTFVTAVELDQTMKSSLIEKITKMTGKNVLDTFVVDPKIKGGLLVKIQDWVFDATIENQLKDLYNKLALGQAI